MSYLTDLIDLTQLTEKVIKRLQQIGYSGFNQIENPDELYIGESQSSNLQGDTEVLGDVNINFDVDENKEKELQRQKDLIESEILKVYDFLDISFGIREIDEQTERVIIERACGNFLFFMKNYNGTDSFQDYEDDEIVKEILEGDVKVAFETSNKLSKEQRVDKIIDYLMGYGEDIIISKRCIKW